nr:crinkler 29 [Plasmopara viticola]
MGDVELKCALYGEATVFPVKIARDAKVSALQDIIAGILSTQQHSVSPRHVTLYLAHKNGTWLKHDKSLQSFLRGEIDKEYKKARPSWKLTNKKLFGSEFVLGEERIHVLVQVPPQQQTRTTRKTAQESGEGEVMQQPSRKKQRIEQKNYDVKDSHCDATWDKWVQRMEVGDENDPGIAINWADDAILHACLGVVGAPGVAGAPEVAIAPVAQGANAAASGAAIRAWFSGLVVAENVNSPVILAEGIRSSMLFHHLSLHEYGAIVDALLTDPISLDWGHALRAAGLSAGTFNMVTDGGRGKNEAMPQRFVPFR